VSDCRVIKLGGSMLDWQGFPDALQAWCARQEPMASVVIVGGGELVEAIRRLDRTHELSEGTSHWLAVKTLSVTARLAADLTAGAIMRQRLDEVDWTDGSRLQILDVLEFMQEDARSDDPLPETWEVTTDSIAARAAQRLRARELVLLKSALPNVDESGGVEDLAAAGYVDGYFPRCLPETMRLRVVNLRSDGFDEIRLRERERDPSLRSG